MVPAAVHLQAAGQARPVAAVGQVVIVIVAALQMTRKQRKLLDQNYQIRRGMYVYQL